MTTLAAFLTEWREAQARMLQGECMWNEGLALVKEARAKLLLMASDMATAFPDIPPHTLEALVAPAYEAPPQISGSEN